MTGNCTQHSQWIHDTDQLTNQATHKGNCERNLGLQNRFALAELFQQMCVWAGGGWREKEGKKNQNLCVLPAL